MTINQFNSSLWLNELLIWDAEERHGEGGREGEGGQKEALERETQRKRERGMCGRGTHAQG